MEASSCCTKYCKYSVEEVVVKISDVETKGHVWWGSHVAQAQAQDG